MSERKSKMEKRATEVIKEEILAALETVIDPELGVDIVNLGLVYAIDLKEDGTCEVQMTLTTMGCPLTNILADMVERALKDVPEVAKVDIQFVWEPAWTTDRMTTYAKMALGIH